MLLLITGKSQCGVCLVSCKWSKPGIGKMWKRDYSLLSICRADLCDFGLYIIRSWMVCMVDLLELHCIFSMFYPGNQGLWDCRITESFVESDSVFWVHHFVQKHANGKPLTKNQKQSFEMSHIETFACVAHG